MRLFVAVTTLILVASACSDSSTSPTSNAQLSIRSLSVVANPNNVLSAIVYFNAVRADSASVSYSATTDPGSSTPWYHLSSNIGRIAVLGLLPSTTYTLVLNVAGNGSVTQSTQFTTGEIPSYFQRLGLTVAQGSLGPGFNLIAPLAPTDTTSAVAFDSIGRLRWYRYFPGENSADVKMQHNGNFTIALSAFGNSQAAPGSFTEFSPDGNIIQTWDVPFGFPDFHEFWLTGDSASGYVAHMWGYNEIRQMNLTSLGGPASQGEYGHTLYREGPGGAVQFAWDTWNYFTIADWIEPTCCPPKSDFDHPNVLDFAPDSNYIISFRNFGAVLKVDRATGKRLWQLGGTQSTLTFQNDPLGFFSGQHNVHFLPNGHLLVFDNGLRHTPPHSRAAEYAIDEQAKTATLVWEYLPTPQLFASFIGSAERLQNGNTVVGFGALGQIDEVDPLNNLLGRAFFTYDGKTSLFYRTYRLPSLYKYQAP